MADIWDQAAQPAKDIWEQGAAHTDPQTSAAGDLARGALSKVNPLNMYSGAMDTLKAIREKPLDVAKELFLHPFMAIGRGVDALKAGKPEEAAAHFSSALLDPPGASNEDSRVKMATPGERATGVGEMLGTGAASYAGGRLPEVVPAPAAALKAAAEAGGKDMALGAVKAATGYGVIHLDPAGEVGSALVGAPVLKAGLKQMGTGAKAAYRAGKESLFPAIEPPPLPVDAAPTAPNPYAAGTVDASTNTPAAIVSPAIAPQAPVVQPAANPYFAGAGTAAPEAAPPVIPAQAGTNPVSLQQAVPPSPNSSYASDVAAQIKASADAKDARFADHLASSGKTSADVDSMSIDQYKALHGEVPTGKTNAKSGKPTKFTLSGDDTKMAARKDALSSLMRRNEASAALVKNAAAAQSQGITADSVLTMKPEELKQFGVTDSKGAQDLRFQLQQNAAAAKP
jgi:hypothetical protein